MLANPYVDLAELVRVTEIETDEENRLGTVLPTLVAVRAEVRPYGLLAKPHWVDALAGELQAAARKTVEIRLHMARTERLAAALKTVTQRVNLFEKVLIPRAEDHIRRIQVHLSDAERAAVVRAKIAKTKRARLAEEGAREGRAA